MAIEATTYNTKTALKIGLDHQRERFKAAKSGTGINNFDLMADSIENIKSEIKQKAINAGCKKDIDNVERILQIYRTIELKYMQPTPEGMQTIYPPAMNYRLNVALTNAFEILIKILTGLDLL